MRLVVLSSLLLALSPMLAEAKTTDRNAPMDIEADTTDALLGDDSDSILNGNVRITQGSLDVGADNAVIRRRAGEISEVVLTGSPATLKQLSDSGEPMDAAASKIVYTLSSDIIVLTGNVVITQPRGTLRGESVKYDMATGRLTGGTAGSRVKMRIMPKTPAAGAN